MKTLVYLIGLMLTMQSAFSQSFGNPQKLTPINRTLGGYFGHRVDISEDYAIIGEYFRTGQDTGFAYIFRRIGGSWVQVQRLKPTDGHAGDWFGFSVAINGDYAVVGSPHHSYDENGLNYRYESGCTYIFKNTGGNWTQIQKIASYTPGSTHHFGWSIDMCDSTLLVGAPHDKYNADGTDSTTYAGAAYFYKQTSNGLFMLSAKVIAPDRSVLDLFGWDVGLSENCAIIGSPYDDVQLLNGGTIIDRGSVYLYNKTANGNWILTQNHFPANGQYQDKYGSHVAISGNTALVGVPAESYASGSAYILQFDGTTWNLEQKLTAPIRSTADAFGSNITIFENHALVGAVYEDHDENEMNRIYNSGSVYYFKRINNTWLQQQKIVAPTRHADDEFGNTIAFDGASLFVGVVHDSNETGAVYTFELPNCDANIILSTKPYNTLYQNAGASQQQTYYWGLGAGLPITAEVVGGQGPFSYSWQSQNSFNITYYPNKPNRATLWYPTGPDWVYVTVTDLSTGCTVQDSVFVDWADVTCNQPYLWWYQLCNTQTNTITCVKGTTNMQALLQTGNYVFYPCNTQKSTETIEAVSEIKVMPNPNSGSFVVSLGSNNQDCRYIEILDMSGKRIYFIDVGVDIKEIPIQLNNKPGIYLLKLHFENYLFTEKIILF